MARMLGPRAPMRPQPGTSPAVGLGVLLIDPIPLFRDSLAALVSHTSGLRWLGATPNARTAVALCERLHPQVVILDCGLDPACYVTRLLISGDPNLTVVALVRHPYRNGRYVEAALSAGVHGLLLRSSEPGALVEGVRRAHVDRRFVDPNLSALSQGNQRDRKPGGRLPLSRREHQVLELVAEGMDNQAIGNALFVSVETVRTHVKSILRKLRAHDRAHAVSLGYRLGVLTMQCDQSVADRVRDEGAADSSASTA